MTSSADDAPRVWHKVAELGDMQEGRVRSAVAGSTTIALTFCGGRYGALDNHCPHQGGPLGEGSIENGLLRCPWHGYDYDPITGEPPPGFTDAPIAYPVEVRDDGVYVQLAESPAHQRDVSDLIVETMVAWGVTHVFGMVGHSNLGFADAMRRAEDRGELTFVGIRHEGAASFAASAFGKLTGKPAACFAIAGPGSTNLLTGLYDAKVDRSPVVAISGQVPSKVMGRGAFQDLNLSGAFADVAEYSATVLPGSDHAELATLAIKTALITRGVSHLVLPDEVQTHSVGQRVPSGPNGRVADRTVAPPSGSLEQAERAIGAALRPVVVVGHGARFDMVDVIALAERLDAPILTTFKAKGLVSDRHPLGCGVLGRSGTPVASWIMNESDLLVVFGASFSNHTGIAPYKKTVQVDFDPMALGRFHPVDVPVLGDVGVTARALAGRLGARRAAAKSQRADVAARWQIWRAEKRKRLLEERGCGVSASAVFDSMTRLVPPDAVVTVDVGNNAYSFGRYFETDRQSVLMSGYLGSIGFGFPAAMGAWAAAPGRKVVSVSGDGGFAQYMAELTTAVKYGMAITHVVLNNGQLGKISKEQRSADLPVWQTDLRNPDFAAYAELCGARGFRVDRREDLDSSLGEALAYEEGPSLVEVCTDPDLV